NSTSATFTVAAVNANGAGPASTPTAGIIVGTPTAPARPTVSPLNGAVSVSWTAVASNGAPLLSYWVTLYLNGTSAITPKQLSPGTLSTSFSGLSNGATYAAGVYANNSRGNGPPSALSLKVIAGSPAA